MLIPIIVLFLLGTSIGSFLSVVIPRFHDNIPGFLKGRSQCPSCEKTLKPSELIPLLSYLMLKGRCSKCDKSISSFYPSLEFSTGLLFAISLPLLLNLGLNPIELTQSSLVFSLDFGLMLFWLFCLTILVSIFFYDARYYEIDDRIMIPSIIAIGLITALLPDQNIFPTASSALIGAAIPFSFFGLQILISKGKWIGTGDLRIGIIMGLILGWEKVLLALFLSYIIGSIVGLLFALQKGQVKGLHIPFGPFLSFSTIIAFFFGQEIIQWYLGLIAV